MAHAPLPQLICKSINTSNCKMCPTDFTATLPDVLQSDPVKRLLSQPNILIKTIPLKINISSALNDTTPMNKLINTDSDSSKSMQSELSVIPLQTNREELNTDDVNLLPSKGHGKSEIALVPIKIEKKPCGHYEPCENIICDVAVQQYVDREGSSPMLAINIEENEICASVSKHCANVKCDALSIDHDRCRRVTIKLNRCNRSTACDICGVALKTQRSRVYHKSCTRKNEYRHNETSSVQILKERMREREIQMIQASKIKKNDYTDPVTGNNLAMETLRNNKELIIIPKSVSLVQQQQQQLASTLTSGSVTKLAQQIDSINNVLGKLLPSIPIVLPQSIILNKAHCSNEDSEATPLHVAFPDTLSRPFVTTNNTVPLPQNQYITFTTQTNTHPIPLNDLLLSQSQIVTTPIQPKPLLTPIRVVPITNLITQPSLLHQTQGVPKFCIMPDNTVPPLVPITNPQSARQPASVSKSSNVDRLSDLKAIPQRKKKYMIKRKRKLKRKDFKCSYCFKSFSTDWYFKMHVAMHTGEKRFSCKICIQSFSNKNDLKRHMANNHENPSIDSDTCDHQPSAEESRKCLNCNIMYTSVDCLRHYRQECHEDRERDKAEICLNFIETKINNHELQQELKTEDNKINGYICMPNQDILRSIKTELCHEV